MNLALDALGGDNAPQVTIGGALLAIAEAKAEGTDPLTITLVGDRKFIAPHLPRGVPKSLKLFDIPTPASIAEETLAPGEDPGSAIRTALRKHAAGEFDAVVSAGSTGAQVLASLLELEKCLGITRPAVGALIPTTSGRAYLIDVGASLVATPHHLVQFAAMGQVYVRELLGIPEPRIGLVNVAGEALAGDRVAVEAYKLLDGSGFNFVGFLEGRDIPSGKADVIVTNGFVGNVLLKFMEGLPPLLNRFFPNESCKEMMSNAFDYSAFGGEPLMGVKGVSIICHGASSEKAVASAIHQACRISRMKLHEKIEEFLVDKFSSYYSQVKYLRSFRRGLRARG